MWFPITIPSRPQSPRLRLRLFFEAYSSSVVGCCRIVWVCLHFVCLSASGSPLSLFTLFVPWLFVSSTLIIPKAVLGVRSLVLRTTWPDLTLHAGILQLTSGQKARTSGEKGRLGRGYNLEGKELCRKKYEHDANSTKTNKSVMLMEFARSIPQHNLVRWFARTS